MFSLRASPIVRSVDGGTLLPVTTLVVSMTPGLMVHHIEVPGARSWVQGAGDRLTS
jgi:hypothetical protein